MTRFPVGLIAILLAVFGGVVMTPAQALAAGDESTTPSDAPHANQADAAAQRHEVAIPQIELKVYSVELKSQLWMDHEGKVQDLEARMELGFSIMFPDADKHLVAYEDVILDQIVMDSGESIEPVKKQRPAGDAMWAAFSKRVKAGQGSFFRQAKLPTKPASRISKITGHVLLDLGVGDFQEHKLDEFTDAKARTIILKEFPDYPMTFTRVMRHEYERIEVAIHPFLNKHLQSIIFQDEHGKRINVSGIFSSGVNKDGAIRSTLGLALPDKGSISVKYYGNMQQHKWAFEMKNVPVPPNVLLDAEHIVTVELKPVKPTMKPIEIEAE